MTRRRIALFSMPDPSHFQRLLPLLDSFTARGIATTVFAHGDARAASVEAGADFFDLFTALPIDDADAASHPYSSRYVSYAARYGDAVANELTRIGATHVVYDTFAVVGLVAALRRGLPHVNLCAGHNVTPRPDFLESIRRDIAIEPSTSCLGAVDELKRRDGLAQMSELGYIATQSRQLNVYCEPPEFLRDDERDAFGPMAFFGSLRHARSIPRGPIAPDNGSRSSTRIYISFGTIIWRHFEREALEALDCIAEAIDARPNTEGLISLGDAAIPRKRRRRLERSCIRVETYCDQDRALAETDLFVTHHGLNSTHEAIMQRVPMLSYPFLWDQPALARRCQEFGIALPLCEALRSPLEVRAVQAVIDRASAEYDILAEQLEAARLWEESVIASRETVVDRILSLADA
jgi:UDP:flavonoid glycosyltransferase YjiC (YdhE family)